MHKSSHNDEHLFENRGFCFVFFRCACDVTPKDPLTVFMEFVFSFQNHESPTIQATPTNISHWSIPSIHSKEPLPTPSSPFLTDPYSFVLPIQQHPTPSISSSAQASPTTKVISSETQQPSLPSATNVSRASHRYLASQSHE